MDHKEIQGRYRDIETAAEVIALSYAQDRTPGRKRGGWQVVYCPCDNENDIYLMQKQEFCKRFALIQQGGLPEVR